MSFDITGIGSIFDFGSKLIDKIWPDKTEAEKAKLALLQLQQAGEFKELELQQQIAIEQIKVNAVEAQSGSVFVSGGRPAAMWVCVSGLAYTFILQPLLAWAATILKYPIPPVIDTSALMQLLVGMLGLAGWRSLDKKNNVASK